MARIKTTKCMESLLNRHEAEILHGVLVAYRNLHGARLGEVRVILQPRGGDWTMPAREMHWEVWVKTPTKKAAEEMFEVAGARLKAILAAPALPQVPGARGWVQGPVR